MSRFDKRTLDKWSHKKRPSSTCTQPLWGWFRWSGRVTSDDLEDELWDAVPGKTNGFASRWKAYKSREEAVRALTAGLRKLSGRGP